MNTTKETDIKVTEESQNQPSLISKKNAQIINN